MKGMIVTLTPKDEYGIKRNQEFFNEYKDKGFAAGGKVTIEEGSIVRCTWHFGINLPDKLAKKFYEGFAKPLNQAKKEADNFDYKVEFEK